MKQSGHFIKRTLAVFLSVMLMTSNLGLTAFAEEFTAAPTDLEASYDEVVLDEGLFSSDIEAPVEEVKFDLSEVLTDGEAQEEDLLIDEELFTSDPVSDEELFTSEPIFEEELSPFSQTYTVAGREIGVTAEAGVFPHDAALQVDGIENAGIAKAAEGAMGISMNDTTLIRHALYSFSGTEMSGTALVKMAPVGYAALREQYPDAEIAPYIISWDSDVQEARMILADFDAEKDQAEFAIDSLTVYDLVTVIQLPEQESAERTSEEEIPEPVAFEQSKTVNGVVVTVKAAPGVFPSGAELSVETVPVYQQQQADAAVDEVRDENQNVAVSYTFDIKVINPVTGEEYQPAEGQKVEVSFALAEVADKNLETQVYHVTEDETTGELTAESLDVNTETTLETGEATTAVVETDGFSIYTVEFTYNTLEYVLPGDSSVPMSEILSTLGLAGEVEAVAISDTFNRIRDD